MSVNNQNSYTFKVSQLSFLIFCGLSATFPSYSFADNNLPKGITIGLNNLALGEESIATGTNSQAIGNSAIATGGNINKDEFKLLLDNYHELVNQLQSTKDIIHTNSSRLSENLYEQRILEERLSRYEDIIAQANDKLMHQEQLTQQKQQKEQESQTAIDQLARLQNNLNSSVFIGKTKEEYRNFVNALNLLDWNKLKDSNVDRRDELANTLKGMIEQDFSNLQYTTSDYRKIIDGYINAQGGYAANFKKIDNKLKDITREVQGAPEYRYPANYLKEFIIDSGYRITPRSISQSIDRFFISDANNKRIAPRNIYRKDQIKDNILYTVFSLDRILTPNNISTVIGNNSILYNAIKSYGKYYESSYFRLYRPPLKKKTAFNTNDIYYPKFDRFELLINDLESSTNLSASAVSSLNATYDNFNHFYSEIDWNTDKWAIDKDEFRIILNKHKAVNDLLGEYLNNLAQLESSSMTDEERDRINAELIQQRKSLIEKVKDKSNLVNHFKPSKLTNSAQAEFDRLIQNWKEIENEVDQGLRVYDPENEVIQAVISEVDKQAREINTKQAEISRIDNDIAALEYQIQAIQLSPEEQNAARLKTETEQQLAEKREEKDRLEQELTAKRSELLGLQQQLDNTPANQGENALAQGTNAFASGKNSIAFGTESTATAENAIAMGNKSVANGTNSVALGNEAQALKEGAIAIGNKAIVNGKSAVGIGDNIGVSGENAVGIGANSTITGNNTVSLGAGNTVVHNNAVAIGAHIIQTAENSVNLGNESAAITARTEETAGTTDYNSSVILGEIYKFAGGEHIQGVVTVGDKGKERRIQNVAAGLITEQSTDAINGSQLYQMAKAVDEGKLGLVKQDPSTSIISVAGHRDGNLVSFYNNQGETRRLTGISEGVSPTDAINKAQFDREIGRLDGRVNKVEHDVKQIKGSVSTAVAMANMPAAVRPGQSYISAGTGYSNGITAISVGLSHLSDNGRISYKVSGAASQTGNVTFGAGVGFAW